MSAMPVSQKLNPAPPKISLGSHFCFAGMTILPKSFLNSALSVLLVIWSMPFSKLLQNLVYRMAGLALSTEMAIISNFTLNNLWTFKASHISAPRSAKVFQFNLSSVGALLIQTVAGYIGVSIFGPQSRQILLPIIIVFLVLPYNWFMYNTFIWKKAKTK